MDPAVVKAVLQSVVPAGVLAVAAFAVAWWPGREPSVRDGPRWPGPIIVALGVVIGHWLLHGGVTPGAGSVSWYPALAAGAGAAGLLEAWSKRPALHVALRAVVLCGMAWRFTGPATAGLDRVLLLTACVLAGLLVVWGLNRTADRLRGVAPPGAGWAWAVGACLLAMLLRSSQGDAYPAAALAAALGGAAVVALLRPALSLSGGAMTTLGLIGCGNIYRAVMLGEGPLWHVWLVLPLLILGAVLPGFAAGGQRAEKSRTHAVMVVAGLCCLAAAALCLVLAPPPGF